MADSKLDLPWTPKEESGANYDENGVLVLFDQSKDLLTSKTSIPLSQQWKWERSLRYKRTRLDDFGFYTSPQSRVIEYQESIKHKTSKQVRTQGQQTVKMTRNKSKENAQLAVDMDQVLDFYSTQASILEAKRVKQATKLRIFKEKAAAMMKTTKIELEKCKIELETKKYEAMQLRPKFYQLYCDVAEVDESTLTPEKLEGHQMIKRLLKSTLDQFDKEYV